MFNTRRYTMLLMALLLLSAPSQAQGTADLATLMEQTGLKSKLLGNTTDSWSVPFESKSGGTFEVYVTYSNDRKDFALIFTTVVDGPEGQTYGSALLTEALKLSNDYTGVKFVYDQKYGDIDCQAEVFLGEGCVTAEELKMYINAVANVADTTRAQLNALK